ncbi:uncharacterized protein LOC112679559 isoform X1 [Sipha flava]|uniref:Uncharacterized protein LOC112679559 isoform X1 n=1 Tax=Sipha flava TaxID=143950 RepID=A0A8B8F3I8_9HEMI|nr:uncharacterized protein LOC112679559 isoform X1 [Sipha flava]
MADDAEMEIVEETTDPSLDSSRVGTEENEEGNAVVYKLHEEIDNLNLVLDHLERKNGDIYTRIEQLLATFQQNKSEEDDDEDK